MTKKELIISTLEKKLGYSPEIDDDGDIMLRYQMKTIYFLMDDDEEQYVSVALPQFHEIEEGEEAMALAICNKITRDKKVLKVYLDQTFKNVTATYEFYYNNEEALEQSIRNSLKLFGIVRTLFREEIMELSE